MLLKIKGFIKDSRYKVVITTVVMALFQKHETYFSNKTTTLRGITAKGLRSPIGLHSREGKSTENIVQLSPPTICSLTAVLGYAVQEGLDNVWYGERHMDYRKLKIRDLEKCSQCRYVRICGGGCRSNALLSYGSVTDVDPRACTAMKMLEEEIMPLLPEDVKQDIEVLIDKDKSFSLPTGFVKYI